MILLEEWLRFPGSMELIPVAAAGTPGASPGKRPGWLMADGTFKGERDWQLLPHDAAALREHALRRGNLGLRTQNYPALDLDVDDPVIVLAIADLVVRYLGAAPTRTRDNAVRRLLLYKTTESFQKRVLRFTLPDGTAHKVEVLGDGQQCVVYGTHDSGAELMWNSAPLDDLMEVTSEAVDDLLDAVREMLETQFHAAVGSTRGAAFDTGGVSQPFACAGDSPLVNQAAELGLIHPGQSPDARKLQCDCPKRFLHTPGSVGGCCILLSGGDRQHTVYKCHHTHGNDGVEYMLLTALQIRYKAVVFDTVALRRQLVLDAPACKNEEIYLCIVGPSSGLSKAALLLEWKAFATPNALLGRVVVQAAPAWEAPLPFAAFEPHPFPVASLPDWVRQPAEALIALTKAPAGLVASVVLTVCALAAQGLYNVRRSAGLDGPCNLYFIVLAISGERKTAVERYLLEPLQQVLRDWLQTRPVKTWMAEQKAAQRVYAASITGLEHAISTAAKKNDATELAELTKRLQETELKKPVVRLIPKLLMEDATSEGANKRLARVYPSAVVLSSEGAVVLHGHSMKSENALRSLASFNKLWDGHTTPVDRSTGESFDGVSARLSMNLQVQPSAMRAFVEQNGEQARGVGLFARSLLCYPPSTQGTRMRPEAQTLEETAKLVAACDAHALVVDVFVAAIAERITRAWDKPIFEGSGVSLDTLEFSSEGERVWTQHYNRIEAQQGPVGDLADFTDIASKVADNVARLAAALHDEKTATVTGATVTGASEIADWYFGETLRFFGVEGQQSADVSAAQKLERWLIKKRMNGHAEQGAAYQGERYRDAQKYSPVREGQQLDDAIDLLVWLKRLRVLAADNLNETVTRRLCVNPALF